MIIPGFLQTEVSDRLKQRLEFLKLEPTQVLDFTGHDQQMLEQRFPTATIASDVGRLTADEIGLIFSNLYIWPQEDLLPTCKAWQHLLAKTGAVQFCTIGQLVIDAPAFRPSDLPTFLDMHHIGDALLEAGFIDPVMDSEVLTIKYKTLDKLTEDFSAFDVSTFRPSDVLTDQISLQVELVYGLAWNQPVKPTASLNEQGEAVIPVEAIKKSNKS